MKDTTFELLKAIRDGQKHTHQNAKLAPLGQAGLIAFSYPPKGWPAENVRLTDWGKVVLANEEKKRLDRRRDTEGVGP
jgi:hypothetical protein